MGGLGEPPRETLTSQSARAAALRVTLHAVLARAADYESKLVAARGMLADTEALLAAAEGSKAKAGMLLATSQLLVDAHKSQLRRHLVPHRWPAQVLKLQRGGPPVPLLSTRPGGPIPCRESMLPDLAEPLTTRELDVLVLLARRFSSEDVAATLAVSWQTVATDTNSLYRKLGVVGRRAMIERAAALGVLPAVSPGVGSPARAPQLPIPFDCAPRQNGGKRPRGD